MIPNRVLFTAFLISLFYVLVASAQVPSSKPSGMPFTNGVTRMNQLSPGVGWVVVLGHVLWTNDNGTIWGDITPPGPVGQSMYSLYFLDASHAWAVFVDGSGDWDIHTPVRMVRTENGGKTWSALHFDRSSYLGLKDTDAQPSNLWFVDTQHGWFQWKAESSATFAWGFLFSTEDGGVTWAELPSPPSAGAFEFHTLQDGWMVDNVTETGVHVTHDGGKTWQDVSIPAPDNCRQCRPSYDVPKFQGTNNGVLVATFTEELKGTYSQVNCTYVTHDGGRSWQNAEAFEQASPFSKTGMPTSLDGHAIRVFNSKARDQVQIRNDSRTFNSPFPKGLVSGGGISASNFVDDMNGWLVYSATPKLETRLATAKAKGRHARYRSCN
jgi:photosystem II stability/assembly factor-like uncharacterized protein